MQVPLRRQSMTSTIGDGDEDEEALEDPFNDRSIVPMLIEWEGPGERVYVTGTFAIWNRKSWNRKYRLHEK